jgi:hypothetical protein
MTVKELKKALRGVPDDVEVVALKDGVHCEYSNVWAANHDTDEDEDGNEKNQFCINC